VTQDTETTTTFRRGRATVLALGLLLALVAGACGSDSNSTADNGSSTSAPSQATGCTAGTIAGAGSSFVNTIMQQWIKDFAAACPGATVNYQSVGSGAGIQQFTAGTVDFAGSDVTLKPDEETAATAKYGPVVHIPWSSGAIAVEYNASGLTDLQLSPATLAGIFAGKITKWNDAALKADNPSATLPAKSIQVVHRSDGSGTTAAFTSYLTAAAGSVWTYGAAKDVPWPTGQGAKGSDGVTAAVKQADGSIGYAEVSYAKGAGLSIAKVKNASGAFVAPTGAAVAAALKEATVGADLKMKVNYTPKDAAAYAISTVTYVIAAKKPADPAKAKLLKAFVLFALDHGQSVAEGLDYAPLPSSLSDQGKAVAGTIGA